MELQKRLASQILDCGPRRVRFDPSKLEDIKKAITSFDMRRLIAQGIVYKIQKKGVSRARAKQTHGQKVKGRRSGHGSRKGKVTARLNPKTRWVRAVRAQREVLRSLRENQVIDNAGFKSLYAKVKGGFFRSTKHIKIYIKEQNLIVRKEVGK